jgi:hypothetical protein
MIRWAVLADAVVVFHAAYVAFVALGCIAILVGVACQWKWVRGWKFRIAHFAAIALVFVEAISGIDCPLTVLENSLRERAGDARYPGAFVGYWAHRLIFYDAPPWVFIALYGLVTLLVAAGLWFAPPGSTNSSKH